MMKMRMAKMRLAADDAAGDGAYDDRDQENTAGGGGDREDEKNINLHRMCRHEADVRRNDLP